MVRYLFLFCAFCGLGPSVWGQAIEWSKTFQMGIRDSYVDQIIQLEDSSYLAMARIRKWGYRGTNGVGHSGLGLVRLSKFGDTIWVKNVKVTMNSPNSLIKTDNQELLVAFTIDEDTLLGSHMRVYKTDYQGNTLWMYPFIGLSWQDAFMKKVIPSRDGGAYVVGEANSIFPGYFRDGFLAKITPTGQLDFSFRYTDSDYTSLNNIEEMKDGNYLLSGTAGQRIWSCVVDSTGFQLSNKTWFKTNENGAIQDAQIQIGHGALFHYGFGRHSSGKTAIIKFDSIGDSLWVKRSTWIGRSPLISLDGGYARSEGYLSGNYYFSKYNSDSVTSWRILLSDFISSSIGVACIAYDGLGSAVLAGYKKNLTSNRDDMYFIKISNVGYPPNPLSTKPPVENPSGKLPELSAYPNPAQNYFYLQGIKARTKLGLYNLQGHLLKEYSINSNDAVPVWQLPNGLYIWKAEDGKTVWSGKILKEE